MAWLFAAFAIVWLVLFGYLFDLGRKQRAIAREIEGLRAKLGSQHPELGASGAKESSSARPS
jgi:CcmD family protein